MFFSMDGYTINCVLLICCSVAQSCPTPCHPMDYIQLTRLLEWIYSSEWILICSVSVVSNQMTGQWMLLPKQISYSYARTVSPALSFPRNHFFFLDWDMRRNKVDNHANMWTSGNKNAYWLTFTKIFQKAPKLSNYWKSLWKDYWAVRSGQRAVFE